MSSVPLQTVVERERIEPPKNPAVATSQTGAKRPLHVAPLPNMADAILNLFLGAPPESSNWLLNKALVVSSLTVCLILQLFIFFLYFAVGRIEQTFYFFRISNPGHNLIAGA
jgi:hypothetical protein